MHPSKKPRVFYGYWIVVAAFLCFFVEGGTAWFGFSLFVTPLEAEFGWGRGEIMAAFTILFVIRAVAAPFIGRVVDRYGARGVIPIGALIAGLGFVLLSLMNKLWIFYLGYATIGIGMTAVVPVPASAVVSNWFKKRRGMVIGVVATGMGAGGLAMAPLIGGYLIPNLGWRMSYLTLAVIVWVFLIPLTLLVLRTKPADKGLYPDGIDPLESITTDEPRPTSLDGLTLKMALAAPALWLIGASFLLNLFSQNGILQNQVPYLEELGFPVATAAAALGAVALGSAAGKFFFGWLCDRIPAKYACATGLALQIVSILILMNMEPTSSVALIWLYAILMGFGGGSWLPTMSMMTSTTFGLASYGAIFGVVSLIQGLGTSTGPLFAGYMYDIMGTYHWAFIIFLVLCVVSMLAILVVRRPDSSRALDGSMGGT